MPYVMSRGVTRNAKSSCEHQLLRTASLRVANFSNILSAAFLPIVFYLKIQKKTLEKNCAQ